MPSTILMQKAVLELKHTHSFSYPHFPAPFMSHTHICHMGGRNRETSHVPSFPTLSSTREPSAPNLKLHSKSSSFAKSCINHAHSKLSPLSFPIISPSIIIPSRKIILEILSFWLVCLLLFRSVALKNKYLF